MLSQFILRYRNFQRNLLSSFDLKETGGCCDMHTVALNDSITLLYMKLETDGSRNEKYCPLGGVFM